MKKYLLQIIGFLAAFLVLNFLTVLVFIKYDWNFNKRVKSITFNNPDYDCLVLGNSFALDGIDAELLSTGSCNSYNLAIGGASVRTNYIQLKEYVEQYEKKPEKVILALDSFRHDFKWDEIHPVVDFTMKGKTYGVRDLPFIKFKWLFRELIKKVISSRHRDAQLVKGQLRLEKKIPDATKTPEKPVPLAVENFKTSPWVQAIAQLCIDYDIQLIVLEMPSKAEQRNSTPVGPIPVVLDNGIPIEIHNFNSADFEFGLDPENDWIGNSHLNLYGAAKFTRTIKSRLKI
ncbi:hypothetical protein [Robertkochia flava]|uniref:hypothetical protein n=1 Tax=Robertkochia flava TaxID=3447986 RepID=UPI001CCE1519|nr:hypothetical protein [Robertkochia marina]